MDNQNTQVNPKKVFVGNLPFNTTQEELQQLFAQHGDIVEVKLITDKFSGRSKGIAFVEFGSEEAAQAAIQALNNSDLNGRNIIVNVARPPRPREDRGGYGGQRHGGGYGGGRNDNYGR